MMIIQNEKLVTVRTGGSSFTKYKPLFSVDERFLLCLCAESIKVFSVETGECCQVLSGHKGNVTSIAHHPKIKLQVLSCSTDQTVRRWDYEDGVLLHTYNIGMPLFKILSSKYFENRVFIVCENGSDGNELRMIDLTKTNEDQHQSSLIQVELPQSNIDRLVSFGERVLMIGNKRKLTFLEVDSKKQVHHQTKSGSSKICCVATHPSEDQCVTGHQDGVIHFWTGLKSQAQVTFNRQHWHSQSVMALEWTPNGIDVFSGGHEGVLVNWKQYGRFFLPRVDPIQHLAISGSNTLRATVHTDNSIKLICGENVKQVIEGFTATSESLCCGMEMDPVTSSLVTNGKLGHLLFYDPQKDFQLMNFDVVNRNYPSSSDPKHKLSRVEITQLSFLKSVDKVIFMATLEFDVEKKRDQKLKFWNFDQTTQQWSLNTVITSPHTEQDVTSLRFHPSEPLCISTSIDGFAKVWTYHDIHGWSSMGAISHKMYACNDSDFSQDGSLIALAFEQAVCVRDASTFDHHTSQLFTHKQPVMMLKFGYNKCNRYLVTCTSQFYHSWDMVNGTMQWTMDLSQPPTYLIADPTSQDMTLFTAGNSVRTFCPNSAKVIHNQNLKFPFASAAYYPSSDKKSSSLYIVSKDMVVYTLCGEEEAAEINRPQPKTALGINTDSLLTPMSLLLNVNNDNTYKQDLMSGAYAPRKRTLEETVKRVLACPAHVLPPMKSLADQFITSLILDITSSSNDVKSKEEIIEDMEVDSGCGTGSDTDETMTLNTVDGVDISLKHLDFMQAFYK